MVDRSRALEAMALEEWREARAQREGEGEGGGGGEGKEDRTMLGFLDIWAGRDIHPNPNQGCKLVMYLSLEHSLRFRFWVVNPIKREIRSPKRSNWVWGYGIKYEDGGRDV